MLNSANWVPIWRTQSRDYNGTATVRILEILEESESREGEGGGGRWKSCNQKYAGLRGQRPSKPCTA